MGDGDFLTTDMAKTLAAPKVLVNIRVDESLSHMHGVLVADLADRVQSILDELSELEGKRVSARELARRAGLKSEAHVGLILNRDVERPSGDVLEKIAKAGSVELVWLTTGEEPRRRDARVVDRVVELDDRYAMMPAVREMARAQGFDEAFIKTWEPHLDEDDQPDADYLWTLCKAHYARWSKKSRAAGNALADLDDAPGRSPGKKR